MSDVHMLQTANDEFPCTMCGNATHSQIRGGPDPRLKCGRCNYVYSASDSSAAKEAGSIPDGMPQLQQQDPPSSNAREPKEDKRVTVHEVQSSTKKIPRSPSFVVVSKDRKLAEFATKKDLKAIILKWESLNSRYDVFELTPKQVSAKIDIS